MKTITLGNAPRNVNTSGLTIALLLVEIDFKTSDELKNDIKAEVTSKIPDRADCIKVSFSTLMW